MFTPCVQISWTSDPKWLYKNLLGFSIVHSTDNCPLGVKSSLIHFDSENSDFSCKKTVLHFSCHPKYPNEVSIHLFVHTVVLLLKWTLYEASTIVTILYASAWALNIHQTQNWNWWQISYRWMHCNAVGNHRQWATEHP